VLVGLAIASSPKEMAKILGDYAEGGWLYHTIMPYHRWPMNLLMADQYRLVCEFRSKAHAVTYLLLRILCPSSGSVVGGSWRSQEAAEANKCLERH
jgi:hypothetical protein